MTVLEVLVLLTVLVPTVTVGAAVIWWARHRGRPAAGAGAAAPAAVVWHQRPLYWAIGLTVAVIILAFIWGKAGTGVMTVIMVGAGAIYLIMKAGTTGKVLGVPLLLLVVFFGPNFTKFTEKFYGWSEGILDGKPLWTSSASTPTTEKMTTWPGWTPGKPIPIGIPSTSISIPVGCSIRFIPGHGELFNVEYQFYSKSWILHSGGDAMPSMNNARITILPKGKDLERIPYSLNCTRR